MLRRPTRRRNDGDFVGSPDLHLDREKDLRIRPLPMHVAHYNFCRRHSTLRMTPAMAANVTGAHWSLEDLHNRVME
jgi:hypothetical protein